MISPAIPANEIARLDDLKSYRILDTRPEKIFDDLVMLASYICETPIALLSLVDTDRQWFKARAGIDAEQTSRSISFCGHAINGRDLFLVPDATQDERFRDNPLVTGDTHVRFYAGVPLVTPKGNALGTLCVIDREPHHLTPRQALALGALARITQAQLDYRKALLELKAGTG